MTQQSGQGPAGATLLIILAQEDEKSKRACQAYNLGCVHYDCVIGTMHMTAGGSWRLSPGSHTEISLVDPVGTLMSPWLAGYS
jgi:hypothetical protein